MMSIKSRMFGCAIALAACFALASVASAKPINVSIDKVPTVASAAPINTAFDKSPTKHIIVATLGDDIGFSACKLPDLVADIEDTVLDNTKLALGTETGIITSDEIGVAPALASNETSIGPMIALSPDATSGARPAVNETLMIDLAATKPIPPSWGEQKLASRPVGWTKDRIGYQLASADIPWPRTEGGGGHKLPLGGLI